MHLTALVDSPEHVCCRYRLAAFRPWLERAGHSLNLVSLPRTWFGRWRLFRSLRHANVVLQRKLLPGWQLAQLRRAVRLLLFDLDDAVFLRDSYSPKGLHHAGRLRRFAAAARASDAVVAGNRWLHDQARRWTSGTFVHVIPTCVDPDLYPLPPAVRAGSVSDGEQSVAYASGSGPKDGLQLVWIGSSSTSQGLEAVRPLLEEIGRRVPGASLKIICDRFLSFTHLPVVACPWSEATEAADLATAQVGIAWTPDDDWSRGKCGLKVLQYMAAGLPVVANPVGVHFEMVRNGETGFLAETAEEWTAALRRLAAEPELRRRMGQAGRRLLEERYSVERGAALWLGLLDGLERRLGRVG
jgi:glycosyltransferase involved in cell wall biosynthesis